MKKVVLFLATLLVFAAVGGYLSLGGFVRAAVQKGGTYALGVETTLGSASVNLFAGDVGLSELAVENPPGFKEENFLEMKSARVVMPLTSLSSDLVEVSLFSLEGFNVNLESKGRGNSNYGVVLENLEKLQGGGSGEPGEGQRPGTPSGGGKEFLIEKIHIADVTARVRVEVAGTTLTDTTVHVPEISIDDLGSEKLDVSELTSVLVRAILSATVEQGAGALPEDILQELEEGLEDIKERGKQAALDKLGETLDEDQKKLLDGAVDGLFGKDGKKD